jgi:hypothetical protein
MQSLHIIMSGTDLLKIIMLVGILLAIMGSRWISKHNEELDERLRLARQRKVNMDFDTEPNGDHAKVDA